MAATTATTEAEEKTRAVIEALLLPTPSDPFLLSRLNSDLCIPLALIAKQHSVVAATATDANTDNLPLVESAVRGSKTLSVKEVVVKDKPVLMIQLPVVKPQRDTIILRGVPATATEQDVKGLFDGEEVTVVSVKADICNTWFVTLADEQQVLGAVPKIREKKIAGTTVRACVKSQNVKPLTTTLSSPAATVAPVPANQTTPAAETATEQQKAEGDQKKELQNELLPLGLPPWTPFYNPSGCFFPGLCRPPPLFDVPPPPFRRPQEPFTRGPRSSHGSHSSAAHLTATAATTASSVPAKATTTTVETAAITTTTTTTDGGISIKRHMRKQPLLSQQQQQAQPKKPQEAPAKQGSTDFNSQFPPLGNNSNNLNSPVHPPLSSLPSGYPNKNFKQYSKEKALHIIDRTMALAAVKPVPVLVNSSCATLLLARPMAHTENMQPNVAAEVKAAEQAKQEVLKIVDPATTRAVSPTSSNTQQSYAAAARSISPSNTTSN